MIVFQCSSASRKIGNADQAYRHWRDGKGFSALLRAEKSEITATAGCPWTSTCVSVLFCEPKNRKLTKSVSPSAAAAFQCSSASRKIGNRPPRHPPCPRPVVSVLFCEPKNRKYFRRVVDKVDVKVSVLFCEPKNRKFRFVREGTRTYRKFQCSSASRKIGNHPRTALRGMPGCVSVLFCEPKNRKS